MGPRAKENAYNTSWRWRFHLVGDRNQGISAIEQDPSAPSPVPCYLLEYCGRLRDLCRPTFLRSTSRASRVKKPA
jgi:hypothetical protein